MGRGVDRKSLSSEDDEFTDRITKLRHRIKNKLIFKKKSLLTARKLLHEIALLNICSNDIVCKLITQND